MSESTRAKTALGRFVYDRRYALGLTQMELSERTGVGQETISGIERAAGPYPRLATLIALAKGLDVETAFLLDIIETERAGTPPPVTPVAPASPVELVRQAFPGFDDDDMAELLRFADYLSGRKRQRPARPKKATG